MTIMPNDTIGTIPLPGAAGTTAGRDAIHQIRRLATSTGQHMMTIAQQHGERTQAMLEAFAQLQSEFAGAGWARTLALGQAYSVDAWQRGVLTADVLRESGNIFQAHEAAGAPPVLCYEYDIVVDGHNLTRPVDALLLENWRRTGAGAPQLAVGAD